MATTGHSFSLREHVVDARAFGRQQDDARASPARRCPPSRRSRAPTVPTTSLFSWPPGNTTSRSFWTCAFVFGEPHLAGVLERLHGFVEALFGRQHELLVRADDAVVERGARDDLVDRLLDVHVAVDDHRHVAGADAERRLARRVGGLHHRAAAGGDDDVDRPSSAPASSRSSRSCTICTRSSGPPLALDDLHELVGQMLGALLGLGMRREDHRVAGLEREHARCTSA